MILKDLGFKDFSTLLLSFLSPSVFCVGGLLKETFFYTLHFKSHQYSELSAYS